MSNYRNLACITKDYQSNNNGNQCTHEYMISLRARPLRTCVLSTSSTELQNPGRELELVVTFFLMIGIRALIIISLNVLSWTFTDSPSPLVALCRLLVWRLGQARDFKICIDVVVVFLISLLSSFSVKKWRNIIAKHQCWLRYCIYISKLYFTTHCFFYIITHRNISVAEPQIIFSA